MSAQFDYPKSEPIIRITRTFNAPRDLVWQAFTTPEHIARWWGPYRYETVVRELDFRVGGKWRFANLAAGGDTYEFNGEFLEIEPKTRMAQTFQFADYPPVRESFVLTAQGDKTLFEGTMLFDSVASRDGMVASGMEGGASESYQRLDALLDIMGDLPRSILTTRLIDAPRAMVFQAFTSAETLGKWWGPNGFTTTTSQFDFKPGGQWRFVMHGPDGRDYQNRITFEEIRENECIRYSHGGGDDVEPVQFRSIITFEDAGGRTRFTLHGIFPSVEERERVIREYGADEGGKQTVGRLVDLIEAEAALQREEMFEITRWLDAPRDLVWEVYSEEKHLAKWWGPTGFSWVSSSLDFKRGGVFHYGMKAPVGDAIMWGRFSYREITPKTRIVFTNSFSDESGAIARAPFNADWPLEVLNVMTLADDKGGTLLRLRGAPLHASEKGRALFKSMHPSMTQGFGGTLDQLEAHLKTLKGA